MNVEHVHEDAELERVAVEIGVTCALHLDDATVGRRQHRVGVVRHHAGRIAEELKDEERCEPRQRRHHPPLRDRQEQRDRDGDREIRPAFAGNDRVGIVRHGATQVG